MPVDLHSQILQSFLRIILDSTYIGNLQSLKYRGYIYDRETGLYYLQSRYYDPVTRRFINADGYISTGENITDYNMFAYCYNNPIIRKGPTGQFWITALIVITVVAVCTVTLSGCSSKPDPAPLPYKTADEAAMAFSNSIYSSCRYIRHEYGTIIYSSTTNGVTTYDFATPVAGTPHSVVYGNVIIPSGTNKVATAHTHPNSNSFSGLAPGATSGDIPNAINRGLDIYVIGPNLELQKYSISSGNISIVGVASPTPLSSLRKVTLVLQFVYLGFVIWEHVDLVVKTWLGQRLERGIIMRTILSLILLMLLLVGCSNATNSDNPREKDIMEDISITEIDRFNIEWEHIQFSINLNYVVLKEIEPINTNQNAVDIGTNIIEELHREGKFSEYDLMSITHSTKDNEWCFEYSIDQRTKDIDNLIDFGCLYVLIDGNKGELIKSWLEE